MRHRRTSPQPPSEADALFASMPVLVAWARQDSVIRWSRNREAVERINHVQVQLFDAGHAPFLEVPEAFNEAAATFLEGLH